MKVKRFMCERGAVAAEYVILLATVAAVLLAAGLELGDAIEDVFNHVERGLRRAIR